ncbi:MAG: hypothetical protein ABIF08_00960 [Nanoarchaeota archaeon]
MADKKLVDYIEKQMKKGRTRNEIGRTLVKHGWKREDVVEGLNEAEGKKHSDFMKYLPKKKVRRRSLRDEYMRFRFKKKHKQKPKGIIDHIKAVFSKKPSAK